MRSVVVVLPASMWAMIPMLRVFSSGNLRGIVQISCWLLLGGVGGVPVRPRRRYARLRAKKWAPRAHALPVVGRFTSLYDRGLHAGLSLGRGARMRTRPSHLRKATI